jgi:hypothetical protein
VEKEKDEEDAQPSLTYLAQLGLAKEKKRERPN